MDSANEREDELRVVLLTGPPGVGKTTMVNRLYDHYSAIGMRIAGITTREERQNGQRVGFKIKDLSTGKEGWLAQKDSLQGPRVGSYRVVSKDLETIGVSALVHAFEEPCDMIIVDEIGPMEMTSTSFREIISKVLKSEKATIATVKFGSHYSEVEKIRPNCILLEISAENREEVYQRLIEQVEEWIGPLGR
jgi:nucleoside-triphosphatase